MTVYVFKGRHSFITTTTFTLVLVVITISSVLIYNQLPVNSVSHQFRSAADWQESESQDELLGHLGKPWKTILFWHDWFGAKWSIGFVTEDAQGLRSLGCPSFRCEFTYDKTQIETADAVVFRYSELEIDSFPNRTSENQRWIWFNREAPTQSSASLKAMELDQMNLTHHINWTMTYHAKSTVLAPYGHFISLIDRRKYLIRPNLMASHRETLVHYRRALDANIHIAEILGRSWRDVLIRPKIVAWMSSHCETNSGREKYVEELQTFMKVDKYGKCGTKECGDRNPRGDWCWEDVLKSKYMFYMAMENVFCEDYITEKAYLPLQYFLVPVVFGGATYSLFLPPGSYINARDYEPEDLADLLTKLSKDPEAYSRYHIWRGYWRVQLGGTLCEMCHLLHTDKKHSHFTDLTAWRKENGKCVVKFNVTESPTD